MMVGVRATASVGIGFDGWDAGIAVTVAAVRLAGGWWL